jgi:hypothetical protein
MEEMDVIRESRGVREDDEEGMKALFMQMLGDPPDDTESDGDSYMPKDAWSNPDDIA